ncbi:MAG TPA: hypothetical protein VGR72_12760 [Candidatus Acidoferrales bacterium]|nr:hypothetical protein [Candidatus Acidoferrales bacterium]HEV2341881.1 hypothetical protein [Candidatus Acidoferrales bacterium]
MTRVALGFRAHSGWAAVVAVALADHRPQILHRGRIELVDRSVKGSVQPYHLARQMSLPDADKFLRRAADATNKMALEAMRAIIADLAAKNCKAVACAVVLASGRPLPPLEATLRSHAMVHTAEGELFRGAIAHAGEKCGLRVSGVKERELYERAAEVLDFSRAKLKSRVTEMGKSLGPPWTSDEKNATLVAWLALAGRAKA